MHVVFHRAPVVSNSPSPGSNVILPLEQKQCSSVRHFADGVTSKHCRLFLVTMRFGCLPKRKCKKQHGQGKELQEKPLEFLREERQNDLQPENIQRVSSFM